MTRTIELTPADLPDALASMETRKIVTHIFSDDELADVWSKHLGVSIRPMEACRSVNADALRAMREVEQMTAARIREAQGGDRGQEARGELRVTDDDKHEISVTLNGEEIRSWVYSHQQERYWKMQMAREFVEGYYQASGAVVS